jgi:hypothetical protein
MGTDRTTYLAMSELVTRHERTGGPRHPSLAAAEMRAFSQNGEDGVLAEIFARIGTRSRWFVEFGVESGIEGNCVLLADVLGWDGLFIEGDPVLHGPLHLKYAANARVRTRREVVTPKNIQQILAGEAVPTDLDVLSVDIDGGDFWVWEAIIDYRPSVVVIEYNSSLGTAVRRVQPREHQGDWNGTDNFGASLSALEELGRRKGYRLVHTEMAGCNAFFVRDDLAEDRFPAPDEVIRVGMPNYFLRGGRHPHDPATEQFVDPFADDT